MDKKAKDELGPSLGEIRSCKLCTRPAEQEYSTSLCAQCRRKMVTRPFPGFVKASAVIVFAALVAAIMRLPESLQAGIAVHRARSFEAQQKYAEAKELYRTVTEKYPEALDFLVSFATAAYRSNDINTYIEVRKKLEGKKLSKYSADSIEAMDSALDKQFMRGS